MGTFDTLRQEAEAIISHYEEKRAAMLPVLRLVQERFGCITTEAEEWVGKLLEVSPAHVHEVVTFYSLFHQTPVGRYHIQLCHNIACALRGAEGCLATISERLGILPGETTPDGTYTLSTVECLCACEAGPVLQLNDQYVGPLTPELLDTLVHSPESLPAMPSRYQGTVGLVEPVISKRFSSKEPASIETYIRDDGYQSARKVLTELTPEAVIAEVTKSNLRGLGGAGFPTGKKWNFIPPPAASPSATARSADRAVPHSGTTAGGGIIPKDASKPHYLVVNADEGEPGTIKDRTLIERDPHRLLEGIIIAAYATGCRKAYIYIRGEYAQPARILQQAIEEAYRYGFLGKRIFNAAIDLDVVVHRGAGAYICGEESALLESLEGKKGFPRLRPPYPAISGLFASPTVINNVETLACVPTILQKGGDWFAKLGFGKSGGTRLFSVSGHVRKPGLYEASHGVTLRELIEAAGGVPEGRRLKAVIPGGISAKILRADEIDVHMDFDSLLAAGTMAGSAGVIVMDDSTCMLNALWYAAKFFAHESCGQCSPCREGTGWVFKIVDRIMKGQGRSQDLDTLLGVASNMEGRTICVFADAAAWPVQSYITKFRDEFEFHIRERTCNLISEVRGQMSEVRI